MQNGLTCGPDGGRTHNLVTASHALRQLSYRPKKNFKLKYYSDRKTK